MPSNSGCRGDGKINDFVADEKATGQVDRPVLQQIEKHTGSRLALCGRQDRSRPDRYRRPFRHKREVAQYREARFF